MAQTSRASKNIIYSKGKSEKRMPMKKMSMGKKDMMSHGKEHKGMMKENMMM